MNRAFVSLTFDDGWKSAVERAHPLLERNAIPATFYIISDRLATEYAEYMDVVDIRKLAACGHEIGVHTRSHKHLPELSEADIWHEITQGLEDLRFLGFEPRTFAYPFGEWNPYVVKQVREAGFFAARSIERGVNGEKANPLLLRAEAVREEHSAAQVIGRLAESIRTSGWLILYFHQIEPAAVLEERKWIYGTTPEILADILEYLVKEHIEVLTLEKGMERLVAETLGQ